MTVMTTNVREFDINTLVLMAYQYAGLMNEMQTAEGPQWDAKSAYGRRQLEVIIDGLVADGIFERHVQTYDVAVTAGSASVELPVDTVDVRGDGGLLQDDGSLFKLLQITRQTYVSKTPPAQAGTPSEFYVSRGAPMLLLPWPVPDGDCTIRIQRQVLAYDSSAGAATVDLERYWTDYLLHELAVRVAMSNGVTSVVQILQAKATAAKNAARGKASGQLSNQIVVRHPGPYTR